MGHDQSSTPLSLPSVHDAMGEAFAEEVAAHGLYLQRWARFPVSFVRDFSMNPARSGVYPFIIVLVFALSVVIGGALSAIGFFSAFVGQLVVVGAVAMAFRRWVVTPGRRWEQGLSDEQRKAFIRQANSTKHTIIERIRLMDWLSQDQRDRYYEQVSAIFQKHFIEVVSDPQRQVAALFAHRDSEAPSIDYDMAQLEKALADEIETAIARDRHENQRRYIEQILECPTSSGEDGQSRSLTNQ